LILAEPAWASPLPSRLSPRYGHERAQARIVDLRAVAAVERDRFHGDDFDRADPVGLLLPVRARAASGILAYSFLGPASAHMGAMAGLCGLIVGSACIAIFATSSPLLSMPRSGTAIIIFAAGHYLLGTGLSDPLQILATLALCIALANLLQIIFGLSGLARLIAYIPYPALAGLMNGIGLSIVAAQVRPMWSVFNGWPQLEQPAALSFVCLLVALVYYYCRLTKSLPARWSRLSIVPTAVVMMATASMIFYAARATFPALDLGRPTGSLSIDLNVSGHFVAQLSQIPWHSLAASWPDLLMLSVSMAILSTLETLTAFRMAQTSLAVPVSYRRDLTAYGAGNFIAGIFGGMPCSVASAQSATAYREGGRSRIVALTAAITVSVVVAVFGNILAAIPVAAFNALLVFVGITLLDTRSLRIIREVLVGRRWRESPWFDALVIVSVTAVTFFHSILAGLGLGILGSCLSMIWVLTRTPIIRAAPVDDGESNRTSILRLRKTSEKHAVLQLSGVLFFANSEQIRTCVTEQLVAQRSIRLEMQHVCYMDITAALMLSELIDASWKKGEQIVVCSPPRILLDALRARRSDLSCQAFPRPVP
jgi:SulP family sulfate permease